MSFKLFGGILHYIRIAFLNSVLTSDASISIKEEEEYALVRTAKHKQKNIKTLRSSFKTAEKQARELHMV